MPDLGTYAFEVITAYAASIAVLAVLVGVSVRRSRRVKRTLEEVERG
ncbi:heme exporter protein CcmD [Loktanella sp. DJP18]